MSAGTLNTRRLVGGSHVLFDMPWSKLAQVEARVAFAEPTRSDQTAAVCYRWLDHGDGDCVVERHDPGRDPQVEQIGSSIDDLVDDLHLSIASHATDELFVHAGVVGLGGHAILLPGRSWAGKSTLVHALVQAGASYLSDEYARVTPDGRIAPYPRPIQLRTGGGRELVDPHTIGKVAQGLHRPALVVLTHHHENAKFDPVAVPPAQAALELFNNIVVAQGSPALATRAAAQVARAAVTVRSSRGEAADAASAILTLAHKLKDAT